MLHIDFSEMSCVIFFLSFFFVKLGSAMTKLGSAIALSNDLITLAEETSSGYIILSCVGNIQW